MPSWKKVILSGSDAALNSLDVTTNVTATSFTGSLLGTASYADQAATASYVATSSYVPTLQQVTNQGSTTTNFIEVGSISTSTTGGFIAGVFKTTDGLNTVILESAGTGGTNPGSTILQFRDSKGTQTNGAITYGGNAGDYLRLNTSAGTVFGITGSGVNSTYVFTGNNSGTGSFSWDLNTTFIQKVGGGTTQFLGNATTATSASHALNANNAISSSYALSGSYSLTATSASHALNANNAISSSYALSGSYSLTATSASHALNANNTISSSYALSGSYSLRATSASYALTASYAENITISGSIVDVNAIDFDTSVAYTLAEGRLGWDSGEGTLQLGLEGGNVTYSLGEQVLQYVYNAEATTLNKGEVVLISGSQGNRIAVVRASDQGDPTSAGTLGLVAESITAGGNGWVMTEGPLRKVNTLGLTAGSLLYLSSTPGAYTQTPPTAPSHSVRIGYVQRVSATVGIIYVKVDNGYELGELHNIIDTTTTSSYGDLLVKSGSVWINSKQLTGSYGLTGSLNATSFTGSLLGTASYAAQALSSSYALSASHAIFADTASFLPATTNLNIASISASTAVFTSASIGFLQTVSGSATIIGDAYVVVNSSQTTRYAGLAVYESGSNPPVTASWNFDSQTNDWFYSYSSSGTTDYGVALFGPAYSTIGSPTYLTTNRIPKAQGSHHLNDSNISDNGTTVSINSNTEVTGSLKVTTNITSQTLNVTSGTGSFTGSFTGLFDGLSAGQIATGAGTVNTLAKWNTTSSLTDSSITDNGSIVRIAVNTAITGSITNTNAGFKSVVFTSGSSVANTTTNGTLFTIDPGVYESITMDYVVFDSTRTNKRAGTLRSTWDDTTSAIVFDETSTTDIGNTTGFTLDVVNNGTGTVSVRATNNVGSAMTIIYEYKLLG